MSDNFYEPSESRDDIIGLFFKRDERALELADRVSEGGFTKSRSTSPETV